MRIGPAESAFQLLVLQCIRVSQHRRKSPHDTESCPSLHSSKDYLTKKAGSAWIIVDRRDLATILLHKLRSLCAPDSSSFDGKRREIDPGNNVSILQHFLRVRSGCRRSYYCAVGCHVCLCEGVWTSIGRASMVSTWHTPLGRFPLLGHKLTRRRQFRYHRRYADVLVGGRTWALWCLRQMPSRQTVSRWHHVRTVHPTWQVVTPAAISFRWSRRWAWWTTNLGGRLLSLLSQHWAKCWSADSWLYFSTAKPLAMTLRYLQSHQTQNGSRIHSITAE